MQLGIHTMKPTANFGLWGSDIATNIAMIKRAEALGFDSVWTAEASGTDAIAPLAWIAGHTTTMKIGTGIMQMAARTPTLTAMTAATLDHLSGGRFILGVGAGGPAVVEGWHCQAYGNPVQRSDEYIRIVRQTLARSAPVVHHGEHYDIPYTGPGTTGLANPIKLMIRPKRKKLPIYLAAMGPKNLNLAFRVADGIVPAFYSPWREKEFFDGVERGNRPVEIAPFVPITMGDDLAACRDASRMGLAFWIGAMGARGLNFYNRHIARLGFEDAARKVQDLYMLERRTEAAAAIPDQLIDEVTLVGPKEHIRDQLEAWKESSVTTMILTSAEPRGLHTIAELML
jgi:F420-dependent oxidoreductase-like protein